MLPIAGQSDDVLLVTLMFTEVSQLLMEKVKRRDEEFEETINNSEANAQKTVDVDVVSLD